MKGYLLTYRSSVAEGDDKGEWRFCSLLGTMRSGTAKARVMEDCGRTVLQSPVLSSGTVTGMAARYENTCSDVRTQVI